jgi:hypothetical protein
MQVALEFWHTFLLGLAALNLDLSAAAIVKYGILLIAVIGLLWVLGDVYRGELQNRDMPVDVVRNDRSGYGATDVLFTRRTFDTRSERLPARIIIEHRFLILHDGKEISKRVQVLRRSFKLHAQPKQSTALRDHQFAFGEDVEKEIKNRAEYLVREALRQQRSKIRFVLVRKRKDWVEPQAVPATYTARIHFPSDPFFLLFQHPDREVKATGWLTLLTSAFALLAQFLFSAPDVPHAPPQADAHISSVHSRNAP